MYEVFTVNADSQEQLETLGSKEKFWFPHESLGLCLFKKSRELAGDEWSEKVPAELASLIGLPHARYEIANCGGIRGVITPNFVPAGGRLILGNELLRKWVKDYPADGKSQLQKRQHRLSTVLAILKGLTSVKLKPPLGWQVPGDTMTPTGVFIGYLMLDALVANQDRHHANWGIVSVPDGLHLAPTFDHASSLGTGETDRIRLDRLNTRDVGRTVERYVSKDRSSFYPTHGSTKPLGTVEAFARSGEVDPVAAQYWLGQLEAAGQDSMRGVIASIPTQYMSQPAKDFAFRMLELNFERLMAEQGRFQ